MSSTNTVRLRNIAIYSPDRVSTKVLAPSNYVGTDNLLQNKAGKVDAQYTPSSGNATAYKENDILIANIRPYLRKIWCASNAGGSSADVLTLRVVNPEFDEKFVYYALFRDDFFRYMMQGSKGSKMPRGDKEQVLDFPIPHLAKDAQQRISKTLSLLDQKIELNRRTAVELEALVRTIYEYWFVQFDYPSDTNRPFRSSGGTTVSDPDIGHAIPMGWGVSTVGDLVELDKGIAYTSKEIASPTGLPMINLGSIDVNREYRDDKLKFFTGSPTSNKIVSAGDMLLACTDLTSDGAIIGCPIFVPANHERFTFTMDLAKINITSNIVLPTYIYMTLRTPWYHEYIKKFASGTNVSHLDTKGVIRYMIAIPPIELQQKFENLARPIFDTMNHLLVERQELEGLRDWLLPMFMNGQIKARA